MRNFGVKFAMDKVAHKYSQPMNTAGLTNGKIKENPQKIYRILYSDPKIYRNGSH